MDNNYVKIGNGGGQPALHKQGNSPLLKNPSLNGGKQNAKNFSCNSRTQRRIYLHNSCVCVQNKFPTAVSGLREFNLMTSFYRGSNKVMRLYCLQYSRLLRLLCQKNKVKIRLTMTLQKRNQIHTIPSWQHHYYPVNLNFAESFVSPCVFVVEKMNHKDTKNTKDSQRISKHNVRFAEVLPCPQTFPHNGRKDFAPK